MSVISTPHAIVPCRYPTYLLSSLILTYFPDLLENIFLSLFSSDCLKGRKYSSNASFLWLTMWDKLVFNKTITWHTWRPSGHMCIYVFDCLCCNYMPCSSHIPFACLSKPKMPNQVLLLAVESHRLPNKGVPGCKDAMWNGGGREANKVTRCGDAPHALVSKAFILCPHSKITSNLLYSKWLQNIE